MLANTQTAAPYLVPPVAGNDDEVIRQALNILMSRLRTPGESMCSPMAVKSYLRLKMAELGHEVFGCLFVDVRNRVIAAEDMFSGTLTQASVYPREVVKAALMHNAAGVILYHNHPSGTPEPSTADRTLTDTLKQALSLVDVRVLDHFVVTGAEAYSFAEHGDI